MENALSFTACSLLLVPSLFHPLVETHIRQRRSRALVIRKAFGSDENGQLSGFPNIPNKIFMEENMVKVLRHLDPKAPLKVDVDFLNDRMQEGFLQRIRYAMKPDEAYGLIFSWDVVADTQALKVLAWELLASEEGKEIPKEDNVQRFLLYAGADHVLNKIRNPTCIF